MIDISETLLEAVDRGEPTPIAGKVTMEDGVFSGIMNVGCFSSTGCSIQSGTTGNNFPIGEAICRIVQLELMGAAELEKDPTNPYSYEGSKVSDHNWIGARLELYLCIPDESSSTGYVELTQLGFFNVTKAEYSDDILTITASDDMMLLDVPNPYTTDARFSWRYNYVFNNICTKCGVACEKVSGNDIDSFNGMKVKNIPSGEFRNEPEYKNLTCRQILGYIAMIAGGNVIINNEGNVEIVKYNTSPNAPYHDITKWISYKSSDKEYTVTGIQYKQQADGQNGEKEETILMSGSAGYVIDVTSNPLICRKYNIHSSDNGFPHELNQIYDALKGLTFRTFDCETIPSPAMQFMDLVQITDRAGKKHKSFISSIIYNVLGSTVLKNTTNSDSPAPNLNSGGNGAGTNSGGTASGGATSIMIDGTLLTPNTSGIVAIPNADQNNAGIMSAADKRKLDSISSENVSGNAFTSVKVLNVNASQPSDQWAKITAEETGGELAIYPGDNISIEADSEGLTINALSGAASEGTITGTWTPLLYRHYNNQSTNKVNSGFEAVGIYTKNDNIVSISFSIKWLASSTQNEGLYFTISGIPYTPSIAWSGGGTLEGYYAASTSPNAVFTGWKLDTDSHIYPVYVSPSGSAGDISSGYCRPGLGDMIMSGTITYVTS